MIEESAIGMKRAGCTLHVGNIRKYSRRNTGNCIKVRPTSSTQLLEALTRTREFRKIKKVVGTLYGYMGGGAEHQHKIPVARLKTKQSAKTGGDMGDKQNGV